MFDIGYIQDEIVLHEELCKRAKYGCLGCIRYSKDNIVLLFFIKKTMPIAISGTAIF